MEHNREFGRIGLSDEQADLLEVATGFCREKSPIDKVRQLMESDAGYDEDIWREIVALGWLGIAIPDRYEGGVGLSVAEIVPVVEQMGRSLMASPFVSTSLAAQAILLAGTQAQKDDLLPKLTSGKIATLALMEPEGHWDYAAISAQASGGKTINLTGTKRFVCDAASADYILVSVMRAGKPAMVLVEKSALPEGALRRETVIDETKRSYEMTLDGITCEEDAFLDTDRIPAMLSHIQLTAALLSAAECCGSTQNVIDYTVDYLQTRKQFGKVIGSYQALKHPLVDAFVAYEQSRSHLYSAAHCFDEQGTGEVATRMAKVQTDKALTYAADRSIQFHGGFGFTYDCDAQLYRRRAAWHAALYGDGAYHKKKLADLLF